METLNGHRNTRQSKIHEQIVGCYSQWALGHYTIFTTKERNMILHKMEYMESPHCPPSHEEL